MAYMFVTSPCGACGTLVSYNPDLVPSLNVSGEKQPICQPCVHRFNRLHPELEDFIPDPQAYEPQEVA